MNYIQNLISTLKKIRHKHIDDFYRILKLKIDNNKNIFIFGNGGSATTAQHYVTDWNKMYLVYKKKKFRGFCLNENIGLITAYSNDLSYDQIFSKQLETLMNQGDLVVAISTSGNSKNIINAYKFVKKNKGDFFILTNKSGGFFKHFKKNIIKVPTLDTQICEDIHLNIGHAIMKMLVK
jgi:D-sedoheptulose 7-phosphate isomerase